jgi:hypothetical protein
MQSAAVATATMAEAEKATAALAAAGACVTTRCSDKSIGLKIMSLF